MAGPARLRIKECLRAATFLLAVSGAAPMTPNQQHSFATMKDYAEHYTRELPDYICIQTTRREREANASSHSHP